MKRVTFVTGNQSKAEYLARLLGYPIDYRKVDQEEIQSLDLKEIVEHKVRQAYQIVQSPVLVEDVALEFTALGRLPGPFIKFFYQEMSEADICRLVDGKDRTAVARCVFGYYDGAKATLFEGSLAGRVAEEPAGSGGYGWDRLFIPEGYAITRAQMNEVDDHATYLKIKPIEDLKKFLLHD